MTTDDEILNFGASVTVCDDVRRSVVAEAEEIQRNCVNLSQKIKAEHQLAQQMERDTKHAEDEGRRFGLSAKDADERMSTNEVVRKELLKTLSTMLSVSMAGPNVTGINKLESELAALIQKFTKVSESVHELEVEEQRLLESIDKENYEQRIIEARIQTKQAEETRFEEAKRVHELEESVRDVESNRLEQARLLHEAKKRALSIKQASLDAQREAMAKDVERMLAERKDKEDILASNDHKALDATVGRLKETLAKIKVLDEERAKVQVDFNEMHQKRNAIHAEKTQAEAAISAYQEQIHTAEGTIVGHANRMKKVEELKDDVDTFEIKNVIPLRAESAALKKEIQNLQEIITKYNENHPNKVVRDKVEASKKRAVMLQEKLAAVNDKEANLKSLLEHEVRTLEDKRKASEHRLLDAHKRLEKVKGQRKEAKSQRRKLTKLQKKYVANKTSLEKGLRKLHILKAGANAIRQSKDEERLAMKGFD